MANTDRPIIIPDSTADHAGRRFDSVVSLQFAQQQALQAVASVGNKAAFTGEQQVAALTNEDMSRGSGPGIKL